MSKSLQMDEEQNKENVWMKLQPHLIEIIWEFVKHRRKIYVVDLGSVFGTYIKLKKTNKNLLYKGQQYLIGADTHFIVLDIKNTTQSHYSQFYIENSTINLNVNNNNNNNNNMIEDEQMKEEIQEEWLKYLAMEKLNNTIIHGLNAEQ